jgi:hypothetical protein
MKRLFIEHVYFDRLSETDAGGFPRSPELVGQQASTGKVYAPYDEDIIRTAAAMSQCVAPENSPSTPLDRPFTRYEIVAMVERAGLERLEVSSNVRYRCAGYCRA